MSTVTIASPQARRAIGHALAATGGTIATGALLACGLRIALGATVEATYLVPSGRRTGYPHWMRGPLYSHHWSPLPLHAFLLLMTVMVIAWALLVVLARSLPGWFVIGAVVAGTLVFALAPPLLSTDVFNYIAYGQMGTSGINPYSYGPVTLIGQPVYAYTGHLWKDTPSAYGPLFTLISYGLTPLGVAGAFWAMKALMAGAVLAMAGFVWASARRLGRDPRIAVAIVALNPLVLVYALGGAHNDLLMAAALAAAVYLCVSNHPAGAGAATVTAIAVKASAGLALPFVLLGARPRRRAAAGTVASGIVAVGVSLLVFGTALENMPKALAAQQRFHWIVVSVPSFIGHYAHVGVPDHMARQVLTALAGGVIVFMIVRARGGRGWIEGAAAAALVVLATTAWVLPWYIVWALPFAALVRGPSLPIAAVVLTVFLTAMQLDHFVLMHASHHRRHAEIHRRHATEPRRRTRGGPRSGGPHSHYYA
jgi:hypothetical protein